jgi:peptidyl-prolyl cis-trans isomerase C
MKRSLQHALILAFAAAFSATPVLAESKSEAKSAFATVNGKSIPQSRADALMAAQLAQGQADSPQLRQAVREELVRREVLTQEASKKGFDKKTEIQAQMDLARQGILVGAYLSDFVRANPVTDAQIQKEYDGIKAQLGDKEFKTRHILVETEAEAKTLIEKLKKGEKFEELAKGSKDPGSKDRGGELGWANRAAYVKPFAEAMASLEKGKMTETPVKSDFGWHVIQVDDTRELKPPSFDELKPKIAQGLQQQLVQRHIEDLRGKSTVK